MSMQSVASPAITLSPPNRNSLTHIPGDEGWPVIGRTLAILADPKGEVERMAAKYGHVYRSRVLGETSISVLGPEANEFVLFDQSRLFSSTHGWGTIPGRLFRRTSPAPARAVGLVQIRADEILSRGTRCRHL